MSRTTGKVIKNEFYPTPAKVVDALLETVSFRPSDVFLEPCRGEGAIYNRIPLPGNQKCWAELSEGVDYLKTPFNNIDVIITNPPFSLATDFLEKAKSELSEDGTMIFLLRLNFLGSKKRVEFWEAFGTPPHIKVITPRPSFAKINNSTSDTCEYGWFIWDHGNRVAASKHPISHIKAA